MGLFKWIKGVIGRMFRKNDAVKAFGTDIVLSDAMNAAIMTWYNIIAGRPYWVDKEDDIDTINFAKFIASDTAKKICLDIDINIDGSARADYIKTIIEPFKKVLRDKVEDACCVGGIMFKPNGNGTTACIDYVQASDFLVTEQNSNGDIRGAIFFDYYQSGNKYYTRMEYHRFEGDNYRISNKAYQSERKDVLGREVAVNTVPVWDSIEPEVSLENVTDPLFAYYKMPYNNTIDSDSPLGVSVFSNAIKELRDLDVAWSRKAGEVEDSKHITIVGPSAIQSAKQNGVKLPRFLKPIALGDIKGTEDPVHEHIATLLTEDRIKDINSILSMISTKCGFSQGAFVLDRKTGNITATQVEADDRETIETIKDMRDALKDTIEHLIYAIGVYADLYNYAPVGEVEAAYSFGDITYSLDEDRNRWLQYANQGRVPFWLYLVKFEGMSEEEAKEVCRLAKEEEQSEGIFDEE